MCGIGGIYHFDEPPERWRFTLSKMLEDIRHRGPDEIGFFSEHHVSMGVRRLNVIDLDTGSQPISNEDGTIHIVFNGEIYRFEALSKALREEGHLFKTRTDTEVILHLYEKFGTGFLRHIDGMFSFALWDGKLQRLILARDRFGIKPLFYTTEIKTGLIAFSSEIRPLLNMPGLSKEIDAIAIDQFFALSYILHPRSAYKNIKKLSPGSYLLIEKARIREIRYWDLPEPTPVEDQKELAAILNDAIADAVETMMRCDVPYGAFLSGGLDSGTIVYHMAKNSSKPIPTFSIRFDEKSFDEGKEARLISRRFKTDHNEIWVRPEHVRDVRNILFYFGEPFADPSLLPTFLMSKLARQKVTVALSGDGGDEVLGGYLTYVASSLTSIFSRFPESAHDILLSLVNRLPSSMKRASFDYKLKKFISGCRLPPIEHHAAWKTIFTPEQRKKLYSGDFCERIDESIDTPIFEQWNYLFRKNGLNRLTRYQYLDIKTFLADDNLARVDRMSMANSLEVRLPFLDTNVVEAAFRLSPDNRIRRFTTKYFLRKTMKDRLPDKILRMGKRGFAVPLGFWIKGPLSDFVKATLSSERIRNTGMLCPNEVSRIVDCHLSGRQNLNRQIWSLVCFMHWFEDAKAN